MGSIRPRVGSGKEQSRERKGAEQGVERSRVGSGKEQHRELKGAEQGVENSRIGSGKEQFANWVYPLTSPKLIWLIPRLLSSTLFPVESSHCKILFMEYPSALTLRANAAVFFGTTQRRLKLTSFSDVGEKIRFTGTLRKQNKTFFNAMKKSVIYE